MYVVVGTLVGDNVVDRPLSRRPDNFKLLGHNVLVKQSQKILGDFEDTTYDDVNVSGWHGLGYSMDTKMSSPRAVRRAGGVLDPRAVDVCT